MTNSEYLHERLMNRMGMTDMALPPRDGRSLEQIRAEEWSSEFESLMRNRLVMGAMRYGKMARKPRPGSWKRAMESAKRRIAMYEADGNAEHLVDVANLCLCSFVFADHPQHHFSTGDGTEHC